MSLPQRIRAARDGEAGFAIVLAVALIALISIVAVALPLLVQGEDSKSRRDQTQDGAFQAAEAGTNAVLSDLTQSTAYYTKYMAKGEATRTDSHGVAYTDDCTTGSTSTTQSPCTDLYVGGDTWTSWTYTTSRTSDKGWYSLGNGYQYLIQVTPPNTSLSGLAATITRIDVTGRPFGGTDLSEWRTIETMIRPSSLTDFQAFTATNLSYASGATTTGPVFVGEDANQTPGSLDHEGTADANLYAEGTVTVGHSTLQNGSQKYDSTTNPTALCKLNNCATVPWSSFSTTFAKVSGAASSGGISLGSTDLNNSALKNQSPAYHVDAWKIAFQSGGTVIISSCMKYNSTTDDYDSSHSPTCGDAQTYNVPSNGAIYSIPDVLISGVVKGQVTVATAGNVIFGGNTTYNTPGVDVLGVEATGSVIVPQWGPDSNHNITIYAAEFALNGLFERDPDWTGNPSGTMNFYGSTAVYGSSPCYSSDCAIIFSDFFNTRNYNYDANLLFVQPPYWPSLGNAFTILVQRQL